MDKQLKDLLSKLKELTATVSISENNERFIAFTQKEIMQMPKTFRKVFRLQGCTAHVRKRQDSRYNCSYEIRYTRDGYNISASGTTLAIAKQRFIEKINNAPAPTGAPRIPRLFNDFADYWFDNFHKRKVKPITYTANIALFNRHIRSKMNGIKLSAITPVLLQSILDAFDNYPKTADDIYSLFNQILNSAVNHGVIRLNPLGMVFHKPHKRVNGSALTKQEEIALLEHFKDTEYYAQFALLLYTGLRPSEFSSYQVDGNFITAKTGKRKKGKTEYKKIPISPMLRPFLPYLRPLSHPDTLTAKFKSVLPHHRLYDLRTTFQTRCTECNISDSAIGCFMGNSIGKLKEVYTDLSDDFLYSEGQKLCYDYPKITPKN